MTQGFLSEDDYEINATTIVILQRAKRRTGVLKRTLQVPKGIACEAAFGAADVQATVLKRTAMRGDDAKAAVPTGTARAGRRETV